MWYLKYMVTYWSQKNIVAQTCLVGIILVAELGCSVSRVNADLSIRATVAAKATDFQLAWKSIPVGGLVGSGQQLAYQLTYGSYLGYQTDQMIVQINWSPGTTNNGSSVDVLNFQSATLAVGASVPIYDSVAHTLTWTVTPAPDGANRTLTINFTTPDRTLGPDLNFTLTARLIGPGVELALPVLQERYHYGTAAVFYAPNVSPIISAHPKTIPAMNTVPSGPGSTIVPTPSVTPSVIRRYIDVPTMRDVRTYIDVVQNAPVTWFLAVLVLMILVIRMALRNRHNTASYRAWWWVVILGLVSRHQRARLVQKSFG